MNTIRGARHAFATMGTILLSTASAADTWPMKQRDMQNTGRASYSIPESRKNSSLFDVPLWQTPTFENGSIGASSMVFFDGAGPGGADLVVAGYHWPKGVQGMDRRTGRVFWRGNPAGGETIGESTPAFSPDGRTVYVINDATGSQGFPAGHPLMAFASIGGPSSFRHNGLAANPNNLSAPSVRVGTDGRIYGHQWNTGHASYTDTGTALTAAWSRIGGSPCYSESALSTSNGSLQLLSIGREGVLSCLSTSAPTAAWSRALGSFTDATVTVDPANGNCYVAAGDGSISVAGVSKSGANLWTTLARSVYVAGGSNEAARVSSGGCLNATGTTYYFQTSTRGGTGRLYAINTSNGSTRWSVATGSRGWEGQYSCPIVTPDGTVIVGTNEGGRYVAIRDNGTSGQIIDTITLAANARATATPTLSSDGLLYLPMQTTWMVPDGDGNAPTLQTRHLFAAIDLREGATLLLPNPGDPSATIGSGSVTVRWSPLPDMTGFASYRIYRSTSAFTSVASMTPIGVVTDRLAAAFTDTTAADGVSYHYAVTTLSTSGSQRNDVASIGPRTPRTETDLQVTSLVRSPQYPRFLPAYQYRVVTEPSGFGPYGFSVATGLSGGQTPSTKRMPVSGESMTYTATIRNRGTTPWSSAATGTWRVGGEVHSTASLPASLAVGQSTTVSIQLPWIAAGRSISFTINATDGRAGNNSVLTDTAAVQFLTYVDRTYAETFRESSLTRWPQTRADDIFDWLQRHAARMNEMFASAGSTKRVSYGVLEQLADGDADPTANMSLWACFPFRFRAAEQDIRNSGYYVASQDIDYGLLHEMAHQLGLVDMYRWDLPASMNLVNGIGYQTETCLMHGVSQTLSPQSAGGMNLWQAVAHGYYGQYMYAMPVSCTLRLTGMDGRPLSGVQVRVHQKCDRPGQGEVVSAQVKATGTTDADGRFTLPNVPIDPAIAPPSLTGDVLRANPFGYLDVVGTNGLLMIEVEDRGIVDHAWLDIAEVNRAFFEGRTGNAEFERRLALGGDLQTAPPADMTEQNASSWRLLSEGGAAITASDDPVRLTTGLSSVRFVTEGGFDNTLRYPGDALATWDVMSATEFHFDAYAENPNGAFQGLYVIIRTRSGVFTYTPQQSSLNDALGRWWRYSIPLAGNADWGRTQQGSPDLRQVTAVEIHPDTWGYGFVLWLDDTGFDLPSVCIADFNVDGGIDGSDIGAFFEVWESGDVRADVNEDGGIDGSDVTSFFELWEAGC